MKCRTFKPLAECIQYAESQIGHSHFVWVNPANVFTYGAMCRGNSKTRLINLSLPTSVELLFASEKKLHLVPIGVFLEIKTKQDKIVNNLACFPSNSLSPNNYFY